MFDETVASDQLDQEVDVVDDTTPVTDDVASNDYSACGKHVIALSTGAVGDPCMTTEAFIDSLSLTTSQKSAALASVNEARGLNSSTESSLAH